MPDDLPEILAAAGTGDEDAWRRVIDLYARRVYALAKSRCRSDELAEEITQSVFATVATKLTAANGDGYTEQGRFESWLFRIVMNRVRDEMRRSRRHASPTDPTTLAGMDGAAVSTDRHADDDADLPADLGALRTAMGRLSESDREIVELRHHAGMSFRQIADLLAEPLGTLLARHHRALKKLREMLLAEQGVIES